MRGQIRVTEQNLKAVCKALINEAENCHYNSLCFGMMDLDPCKINDLHGSRTF